MKKKLKPGTGPAEARAASAKSGGRQSGKAARPRVRVKSEWLESFFIESPDILIVGDTEGRIVSINPAALKILGRRMEDYIGAGFLQFTHPDDLEATLAYHMAIVAGQELPPAIARIKTESGRYVPLEFIFRPILRRGKIHHLMGIARDATLRMETENALRKSESLYKSIANSAAEAIFCLDAGGRIVLWNKAAKTIFGYSAEEVLGKPVTKLMAEDKAVMHQAGFDQLAASGRLENFSLARELPGRRKDGSLFPAECSFTAWKARDYTYISCILRDVSDRKNAQAELQRSEERYRFLFEEMLACNVILDDDGIVRDINRSFIEGLGFSKDEVIGRPAFELVGGGDRREAIDRLKRTLSGTQPEHGNDFTITDKHGKPHTIYFLPGRILLGGEGKPGAILVTGIDVTGQRAAEAALREGEEKYRSLVEHSPLGILTADKSGQITFVNKALLEILGSPSVEATLKINLLEFEPLKTSGASDAFIRCMSEGGAQFLEIPYKTAWGKDTFLRASAVPLKWASGEVRGIQLIVEDITGRKKTEDAVKKSEERYRAFVEHSTEGIWCYECDPPIPLDLPEDEQLALFYTNTVLVECNDAIVRLYGFTSAKEVIGWRVSEFAPPDDPQFTDVFRAIARNGYKPTYFETIENLGGTGPRVYAREVSLVIEDNRLTRVWGVQKDITESKKTEAERALNSQRMETLILLNQMTGATLHEITNFAMEEAVRLTRSRIGYLAFLNEDESVLTMHAWSKSAMAECAISEKPIKYPVETTGLWGEAVRQRRPIITNDYLADSPLKKGYPPGHVAITRHMNVPIFEGSRIVLVAGVGNKDEDYDQDDVKQLTLLMEGMWRLIERSRAEESLRDSEGRFRTIFDMMLDGILLADAGTGRFVMSNQAMCAMLGYSEEEVLGLEVKDIHPEADLPLVRDVFDRQLRRDQQVGHDLPVKRKDGSVFPADITSIPVVINGRKHLMGSFRDVTERKRTEQALRTSEQRYRALSESSPDFIFIIGRNGRLEYVNASCADEFSTTQEKMTGHPISMFFTSSEESRMARNVRNVFESGKPLYTENKGIFPRRELWLNTWLIPLKGDDGTVTSVLGVSRDLTARKMAEDDLREKTTELWAIFQALPDLYFRFSGDGSIVDYKAGKTTDLYLPPESFLGKNVRDVLPSHIIQLHDRAIEKARKTKEAVSIQYSLPMAGSVQHYEARLMPIFEDQYISFVRNITEQKSAEKALIDRERYRALYDRSLDCIFVLDLEGRFLDANPTMQETVGYDMDELLGMDIASMLSEEQKGLALSSLEEVVETGSQKSFIVYRLRCKDGSTVYLESKASAVLREGKVSAVQAIARNISLRVLAQEALKASEVRLKELSAKLRNIIDSSPDAIVVTDMEGIIIECNRSAVLLHGAESPEALIGISSMELLAESERERGLQEVRRVTDEGITRRGEFTFRNSRGAEYPVEISASAVSGAEGEPVGMVAVVHDITDRRQMQEKLIQNEKMAAVGTLVAGLSHELNNPIGIMLGYAQSLLRRTPENDPSMHALKAMEREARRCGNLVKTLLDFSRKPATARKRMNVGILLSRLTEAAGPRAAGAGVELEHGNGCGNAQLFIAPTEIESALLNVLNNAIDASPKDGTVRISAEAAARENLSGVTISVFDQGKGIPAEVLPRIFEPFYTTKPVGKGTGLGLSLARKIIETHGGEIAIDSAPGRGTTVRVWLPLATDTAN
jgi:PAS domain S-box-containing protein